MKITISQKVQTIIEIDIPDQSEKTVSKRSPKKPFSFPKHYDVGTPSVSGSTNGYSKVLCNNLLQLLEDKFNGSFLPQ